MRLPGPAIEHLLLTGRGPCGNGAPPDATTTARDPIPSTDKEPPLAKPEWGSKRICPSCGTRYYDLLRDPIVCPKCSTPFDPEALLRARRARPSAVAEKAL